MKNNFQTMKKLEKSLKFHPSILVATQTGIFFVILESSLYSNYLSYSSPDQFASRKNFFTNCYESRNLIHKGGKNPLKILFFLIISFFVILVSRLVIVNWKFSLNLLFLFQKALTEKRSLRKEEEERKIEKRKKGIEVSKRMRHGKLASLRASASDSSITCLLSAL